LSKYLAVQSLDNPNSELNKYVEFELLDVNRKPFADPSNIVIKQGQSMVLRIENTSSQPLNIALLDLDSTWAIYKFSIKGNEDIFYPFDSKQEIYDTVNTELPDGEAYKQAKETLKLFATRGIAQFDWLTLRALDEDLGQKGNLDEELENVANKKGLGINPLNQLLGTIGADLDNPPPEGRRVRSKPNPNAEWVTKQVTFTLTQS